MNDVAGDQGAAGDNQRPVGRDVFRQPLDHL
jgi:hypothetical protein